MAIAGGLSPESLLRADRVRAQDLGGSKQEKTLPREIKFLPITANYAMKGRTLFQLPNVSSNPHLWALEIKRCNNYTICRKTDKYILNTSDLLSQPGHSLASPLNGSCKNGAPSFDNHSDFVQTTDEAIDEASILETLKYLWFVGDFSKMIANLLRWTIKESYNGMPERTFHQGKPFQR